MTGRRVLGFLLDVVGLLLIGVLYVIVLTRGEAFL